MQNYCKTIGALAAAFALVAGNASAEVEYQLHTGYTSEYLWRGLDLGNDLIEAGLNIKGEWNGVQLSGGVWYGDYDLHGVNNQEIDMYAEASKDLGFLTAGVGYIYYYNNNNNFIGTDGDSQEVYFSLSRDLGFVNASLTYYWDIAGSNNDGYTEFALSHNFELSKCLSLNVASNIGYLIEEGQATAWTTKVTLDWGFAEKAKLSPFVAYSMSLSDDNDTAYAGSENEIVAGSLISVTF